MSYVIKKIPAVVGGSTMLGPPGGTAPHEGGNHFNFREPKAHCLNMRRENLEKAVPLFLPDGLIEVAMFDDDKYAVVIDARLPAPWILTSLKTDGPATRDREIFEQANDLLRGQYGS
jgi:hypothetical protein